ncbi:TPA: DUF1669 domain-containing protein [Candidatus Bathyarchaeota archaeon]|nr:DUF1669 domain-containing protein [Candidatus Bathyarchaeota archaeon]
MKGKLLASFFLVLVVACLGVVGWQALTHPQTVTVTPTTPMETTPPTPATTTVTPTPTVKPEEFFTYSIYFTPNPQVETRMIELINGAQSYIYAAFYDLDLPSVAGALINAKGRGVDVRVVVNSDNMDNPAVNRLRAAGVAVGDEDKDYMHNKFMIVDGRLVWTGSMNITYNGVNRNNNNVVVIGGSSQLVENYVQEFAELWMGTYGGGASVLYPEIIIAEDFTVEVYFAPEDGVEAQIIEEIEKAERNVYFATFTFTSKPIAKALIEKARQGVTVKGIYESFQAGGRYSTYSLLKVSGIEVIKDRNPAVMHHKFFVIDSETVITGSFNPTKHANVDNDENIVIIHNPQVAQQFTAEFERLWAEWHN